MDGRRRGQEGLSSPATSQPSPFRYITALMPDLFPPATPICPWMADLEVYLLAKLNTIGIQPALIANVTFIGSLIL